MKFAKSSEHSRTLRVLAVDKYMVCLAGCELLNSVQRRAVQASYARTLLSQEQVRKVAVEQHLHGNSCSFTP